MKFNHAVAIAFEVVTDDPHGNDFTPELLRHALLQRIISVDSTNEWLEAVSVFDTYEIGENES